MVRFHECMFLSYILVLYAGFKHVVKSSSIQRVFVHGIYLDFFIVVYNK